MGRVGPREMSDVSAQKRSKADINQAAFTYRDMSTRPSRLKIDVAVHGRFHAFHLARALSRRGHDVRLLTNYPSSIVERFGFPRSRTATCVAHGIVIRIYYRLPLSVRRVFDFEPTLHRWFGRWALSKVRTNADL